MNQPAFKPRPRYRPYLTRRQREVLHCLCKGQNSKEIAAELLLSTRTVYQYIQELKRLLNASSRAQIIHRAVEWKLLE